MKREKKLVVGGEKRKNVKQVAAKARREYK